MREEIVIPTSTLIKGFVILLIVILMYLIGIKTFPAITMLLTIILLVSAIGLIFGLIIYLILTTAVRTEIEKRVFLDEARKLEEIEEK